jgi:uncharacterized membrane protein YkoI
MKTRLKGLVVGGLAGLVAAMPLAAAADDDSDHDLARDLYEHGAIHALSEILAIVARKAPGEVVAVDLIRQNNRWVYRFTVVAADGRRTTVEVDAGAASLIYGTDD